MVDFTNPVDPFGHAKVQKTENIGDDKEKSKKELEQKPVKKKLFLYLTFLKILSDKIKIFKPQKKPKEIKQTPLHQEINTIKSSLEALKKNDLCQNTQFMNFFAFIWMKFLKDYENYVLTKDTITKLIKKLIYEINNYPKDAEFTLGYYISEFAGYKWIPFPYMEILRGLHEEYKKQPQTSHLQVWTDILNEILTKI